jgi:1-acyl-sn-glycerol-3-phosphate acyltransferase
MYPRPRELPIAIGCMFAAALYTVVWPIVCQPEPGVKAPPNTESILYFLLAFPLTFVAWLPTISYRALGLVGYGGVIILSALMTAWFLNEWKCPWLAFAQGAGCAFIFGGGVRYILGLSRSLGRLGPMRITFLRSRNRTVFILGTAMIFFSTVSMLMQMGSREQYRQFAEIKLFGIAISMTVIGWTLLFRPLFEVTLEPFLALLYSIHGVGPGRKNLPPFGPCLVISNHAAWLDPLFMEKVLTRPVTAIMTEKYYRLWLLTPLLKYVFRVIVVPETPMRRDAPELDLAIAALDAGHCVLIFPEGFLRRKEEVPLRRFGRGVWQILRARPNTPVISCWIEGGWGSLSSYAGGPPLKNKKLDLRRSIRIGMSAPQVVPADMLEEHLTARLYLMNRVSDARKLLGLQPLEHIALPSEDNEESASTSSQ